MQIDEQRSHGRKGVVPFNIMPDAAVRFHLCLLRMPGDSTSRPRTEGVGSGASSIDFRRTIRPRPDLHQAFRIYPSPHAAPS
jgi:hypothetical protein